MPSSKKPARSPKKSGKPSPKPKLPDQLQQVNLNAAGIDVGAATHFVAVPKGRDTEHVRQFAAFTTDLHRLADWLAHCHIQTVVMESTGVYWIPLFEILDARGFAVQLVNARHVKNVSGRKSDVLDCEWLQQLHTFGLLQGAFRPPDQICALRAFLRQRATLVRYAAAHIQHMQKALQQMNLLLHRVVSDLTGVTGLAIIRAILAGERDPLQLAQPRNPHCKQSAETIAQALVGNFRPEHLFVLEQSLELYLAYQTKIQACDQRIELLLAAFDAKTQTAPPPSTKRFPPRNQPSFDLRTALFRMTGVDLSQIDGIQPATALTLISEIGADMTRWPSAKHFASWLGLCPGTKISGSKRLSSRTKPCANRAAAALRLAAASLRHSQSALGAFHRRLTARLGKAQAVTATAHKLARLVYSLLKNGHQFVDPGQQAYEKAYQSRVLKNLSDRAHKLGFQLLPLPDPQPVT